MTAPFGSEAIVAAALFMVLVGALVFAARPGHALNRTCGALLALQGVSDLMWQGMRESTTGSEGYVYAAVANWYLVPIPFFTLLLCHQLVQPVRPSRWRRAGLAAMAALTLAVAVLYALRPHLFLVEPLPGQFKSYIRAGPLGLLWGGAVNWLAQGFAVVVAARAAVSPVRTAVQRQQAGLVGFAFLALIGNIGPWKLGLLLRPGLGVAIDSFQALNAVAAVAAMAAALWCLPRLADPFPGAARRGLVGAAALAVVFGVFEGIDDTRSAVTGEGFMETSVRFLWVALHAALLALALVRFGMAGFGPAMQRRVTRLSRVAMALAVTLLPAGAAFLAQGAFPRALAVALLLCLGLVLLAPLPWGTFGQAASRFLLLDSGAAAGERAFLYRAELARHRRRRNPGPLEHDPRLHRLRRELGLSEEEHAVLAGIVAAGPSPQAAAEYLGRYRVERELGRGASATAYLARDLADGKPVVLKRFHAGASRPGVLQEVKALRAVRHPRVVPLLEVEQVGGEMFLVLGYADGGSLQAVVQRSGPLPPARALAMVQDVAEGLEAIHAAGLVHGDVTLGNLLVDGHGRVLLGDLGCSRAAAGGPGATLTAGAPAGTLATVAPEVLRGGRPTAQSDLYSLGAVLYALLTGEGYVLLEGKAPMEAMQAVCHAPPRLPHPAIPAALEGLVARLLAKEPSARFAGAAGLRQAFQAAAAGLAAPAPSVSRRRPLASAGGEWGPSRAGLLG